MAATQSTSVQAGTSATRSNVSTVLGGKTHLQATTPPFSSRTLPSLYELTDHPIPLIMKCNDPDTKETRNG
jgi:hypothetical protein